LKLSAQWRRSTSAPSATFSATWQLVTLQPARAACRA